MVKFRQPCCECAAPRPERLKRRPDKLEENLLGQPIDCCGQVLRVRQELREKYNYRCVIASLRGVRYAGFIQLMPVARVWRRALAGNVKIW